MTTSNGWKPSSLAEAKRRSVKNVTCSSGARYQVRAQTFDELAADEALPDDLVKIVKLDQIPGGMVAEIARNLESGDVGELRKLSANTVDLRNRMVLKAVMAPKLKAKDLTELDPYDLIEIALVAQHRLDVDEETGRLFDPFATFPDAGRE